jgi:hypothetical protein
MLDIKDANVNNALTITLNRSYDKILKNICHILLAVTIYKYKFPYFMDLYPMKKILGKTVVIIIGYVTIEATFNLYRIIH